MLEKLFGGGGRPKRDDPFNLLPAFQEYGLEEHADALLKACKLCVEIDLAEFNTELPHTASRLGGQPALPDKFEWPTSQGGEPLVFLGQFTCQELSLAKLPNVPDEGLISIFLDTLEQQPQECQVHHFSLKRDLVRCSPPGQTSSERMAYRPVFKSGPSLPQLGTSEFEALPLKGQSQDYEELLDELEQRRSTSTIQCGGHPPLRGPDGFPSEPGRWEFFLAVHDIEELFIGWAEGGCAYLWTAAGEQRFQSGRATITWQSSDHDWDDEEWDEEDEEWEDEGEDE